MSSSPSSPPEQHSPLCATEEDRALVDEQALLLGCLRQLTDEDVLSAVRSLSDPARRALLGPMRLRDVSARKMNLPVARRVRTFMIATARDRANGAMILTSPQSFMLQELVSGAREDLLTAVSGDDDDLTALAADGSLVGDLAILLAPLSPVMRRLALAAVLTEGHAATTMAAGWLLAEQDVPESSRAGLAELWSSARERAPELPESVRPLTEVVALCSRTAIATFAAAALDDGEREAHEPDVPREGDPRREPVAAPEVASDASPSELDRLDVTSSAADLELAREQVERVRQLLERARVGAAQVAASLDAEAPPARSDIAVLSELADEFDALVVQLRAEGRTPASLPEAVDRLSELEAAVGAAGVLGQVARLLGLSAPEYLAVAAEVVRELAHRAVGQGELVEESVVEGLRALVDVIDVVATFVGHPNVEQWETAVAAQQIALSSLPPTASALVLSASTPGVLTVPAPRDAPKPKASAPTTTVPPASAPAVPVTRTPADAAPSAGASAAPAATEPAAPDDLTPATAGPAPSAAAADEIADAVPADADADAATPGESDPGTTATAEAVDTWEDLDHLLAQSGLAAEDEQPAHAADEAEVVAVPPVDPAPAPASGPSSAAAVPKPASAPVAEVVAEVAVTPSAEQDEAAVKETQAALLSGREFALAGWLTQAGGGTAASVSARFITAYADAMRSSTGGCALAFAEQLRELSLEELDGDTAGVLLSFSAAVRAGLLSPAAGAPGVLRELAPALSHTTALSQLAEACLAAFYRGAHLTPGSSDTVAGFAELEASRATYAVEARDALANGPNRTIRYQLATEVWGAWIAEDGLLGHALHFVATQREDEASLTTVRELVLTMRTKGGLDKAIDEEARRHVSTSQQKKIMGPARSRLTAMVVGIVDLLASWLEATERLNALRATGEDGWQAGPLAELRSKVSGLREDALAELCEFASDGDQVTRAAATVAADMLSGSFALLDGRPLPGEESDPVRVLHAPLLLAPAVMVTGSGQLDGTVEIGQLLEAAGRAAEGQAGWQAAFDLRSARGDHVGTQAVIEVLRGLDPALASSLTSYRDAQVSTATKALAAKVDDLGRRIDADRRYGRIDTIEWIDFSSRLSGLRPAGRRDFDVLLAAAAQLETDRLATVAVHVQAEADRLAARAAADPNVAAVADRIGERIAAADLTTAAEYLELASSGQQLPSAQERVDHLRLFFPALPAAFATDAAASGKGRDARRLKALRAALEAGEVPADSPLAGVLTAAGIDLGQLEPRRRMAAVTSLDRWEQLADARRLSGQFTALKAFMALLGFEVDADVTPPSHTHTQHGRAWAHLSGVRATGKALVPAFGSAMSPAGQTLRVLACWSTPTPAQLTELLRGEPNDESIVVLYFGTMDPATRRALAEATRRRRQPVMVVVDDATVAYLACQDEPSRATTMATLLPFTATMPYRPDVAGLVPIESFFGRVEELAKVTSMMGSAVAYGGRQLGKSALLRAAEREFDDGGARRAVYLSIYPVGRASDADAVWTTLWPKLADKGILPDKMPAKGDVGAALVEHVRKWATTSGNQLLLLLDESDRFLDADSSDGRFTHVARFRELMEVTERRVKVVFAGLHQTARFERLGNHPLAHFGEPICVGPLDPQPAYDLLTRPLDALGFRFADDALASRVLALANNQPALIQLFAAALLNRLHRAPLPAGAPPQLVTDADVDAVWMEETLRAEFRKRFDWTLNLDPRYKVIAYVVAGMAHADGVDRTMSPSELRRMCEERWPLGFANEDLRTDEFRALLNECVDLGVLSLAAGGYRLRTPNVRELLGSQEEVEEVLATASTFDLPESFDGSQYRSPFGSSGETRSPLTEEQVSDVLAGRNQVRLVVGTPALNSERVPQALEAANKRAAGGRSAALNRVAGKSSKLASMCAKVGGQAGDGHAVVVCELREASAQRATEELTEARELIAAHHTGTLGIALVAGPTLAPLWLAAARSADASSGLTELRRYDHTGLRLWMSETTLPFQDDASRTELLKLTGGWPMLVNRVAERAASREAQGVHSVDHLAELRAWLATSEPASQFVDATGVRALPAVSAAWDLLVSLTEDEGSEADLETLSALLDLEAEVADPLVQHVLAPSALAAAGFAGTAELVEVLRMMGALTPTGDATFTCEPVLAAATRTVRSLAAQL